MSSPQHTGIAGMGRGAYLRLLVFFLAPATIIYTLFSVYPLIATIINSLYLRQPDGSYLYNGLGNFSTLLTDTTWSGPFWNALRNNFIFFVIHMIVQNPIGLLLAALLSLKHLRVRFETHIDRARRRTRIMTEAA